MSSEPSFADLAIEGIPFPLFPPFFFEEIPIPIDIFDTLICRYLPGRVNGWVEFDREEITPVSIRYTLRQTDLGELGTIKIYKTGNEESAMDVSSSPLITESEESSKQRRKHYTNVIMALFNFLSTDSTWKKYWKKAKEEWENKGNPTLDITSQLLIRIDMMRTELGTKLDEIKQGQSILYKYIDKKSQSTINTILGKIDDGKIDHELLVDATNSVQTILKYIQAKDNSKLEKEVIEALSNINNSMHIEIPLRQKIEFTIPLIPLLIEYKLEIGTGVDLKGLWQKLLMKK
jgi:hypothetical protein